MIVTIMRHGEAGAAAVDRERRLTPRGEAEVAAGCKRLLELCARRELPAPDVVYHSAWTRTSQTAAIACAGLEVAQPEALAALLPGGSLTGVDTALAPRLAGADHLLLVSHQPMVSRLADHYLGQRGRVPALTPGGYVVIDLATAAAGCGQLCFWALPPEFQAGA